MAADSCIHCAILPYVYSDLLLFDLSFLREFYLGTYKFTRDWPGRPGCRYATAVKRARQATFLFDGMGAFQGELNPLSGWTILKCVLPSILYGCNNTPRRVGRHPLKLFRYHSTLAVHVVLLWLFVQARILMRKLMLQKHLVSGEDVVNSHAFRMLAAEDI